MGPESLFVLKFLYHKFQILYSKRLQFLLPTKKFVKSKPERLKQTETRVSRKMIKILKNYNLQEFKQLQLWQQVRNLAIEVIRRQIPAHNGNTTYPSKSNMDRIYWAACVIQLAIIYFFDNLISISCLEGRDLQVYQAGAVAHFNWNLSGYIVTTEIDSISWPYSHTLYP